MDVGINLFKYNVRIRIVIYISCWVFCFIVLFCVLCKCVLCACNQVSSQLQITNISYHTISMELLAFVIDLIISVHPKHLGPSIALNLCLKMALSNNSTNTDCCEAVLGKCNVMGQTSQLW